MSVGNTKTNGNKGNNFPFQLGVLQLLEQINASIGAALPGADYETRTTMYQAIANGPGYSIGDIIIRYDIINVATSTVVTTMWFNQTLQTVIAAPAPANLTPIEAPSSVTIINTSSNPVNTVQVGILRTPSVVVATVNGNTISGVKSVSLWFRGANGTLGGASIPNNAVMTFTAADGDTVDSLVYTVPTTGPTQILISYML